MCESSNGATVLRAGDRVLIAFHGEMTAQTAEMMRADLEQVFPGVVFALMDQVDSVIVHRANQ